MAFIRYGNYSHAEDEVAFEIQRVANFDDAGLVYSITQFWTLSGELLRGAGETQNGLRDRCVTLENAYSAQGRDLVFYLAAGNPSHHLIRSADTIGGTKVTHPVDWLNSGGAEYVSHRSYRIQLEAEVPVSTRSQLTFFREILTFEGGGPKVRSQESVKGLPRDQMVKRFTTYRATQSGEITGRYAYPSLPLPIFTAAYRPDLSRTQIMSPTPTGQTGRYRYKDFGRTYSYQFESRSPLFAEPARWGV